MDDEVLVDEEMEPDAALNRLTNAILGAAIEVHRVLGPGFLESVYEEAMALEMAERGISFVRQEKVHVNYKGQRIGEGRMDFVVEGRVIVDLKAIEALGPLQAAQMISYLRATKLRLGLIINFNVRKLKEGIKRIAN